jgi:hypothetical protein
MLIVDHDGDIVGVSKTPRPQTDPCHAADPNSSRWPDG